jgi:hypothetical protein
LLVIELALWIIDSVEVLLLVVVLDCVDDNVEVLLLVVVLDCVDDGVEVRLAVFEPDCVEHDVDDFDTETLDDTEPDKVWISVFDTDGLDDIAAEWLGFNDTDGLNVLENELAGLLDIDADAESLYVIVNSGDKVGLFVNVERLLNDSVTDTVLVTPVGNVVGLVVPVLAIVELTVLVTDSDLLEVKVYEGEALCVFDPSDVEVIDTVPRTVTVTGPLRVRDTETVLVLDCAGLRVDVGLDDDVFDSRLLPDIVLDAVAERVALLAAEFVDDALEVAHDDTEAVVVALGLAIVGVLNDVMLVDIVRIGERESEEQAVDVLDPLIETVVVPDAVVVLHTVFVAVLVAVALLFVAVALFVAEFVADTVEVLLDETERVVVAVALAIVAVLNGEALVVLV